MPDFNDDFRAAIQAYQPGINALSKAAGVQHRRITEYLAGGYLRSDSLGRLAGVLGVELRGKRRRKVGA